MKLIFNNDKEFISFLADTTGIKRVEVEKALKGLVNKGAIIREPIKIKNNSYIDYYPNKKDLK